MKHSVLKAFCIGMITCCLAPSIAQAITPNVWDVLRKEFTLNHETSRPEIQAQLRWITSHPSYIQKLSRAKPYIYHIVTEIKKRKLPGEIALLPMIESSYDPFAYSGAGAAGLWQLMPETSTDLGVKRDWWFDGRRSIRPSTDAALNYLAKLNKRFDGNWPLAFAAYDSGEGTISKSIRASRQKGIVSFWSLTVPQETKAYIPRILALAEVIKNPERYHIRLPPIPHAPYFEVVNIGSQIDLDHAAKLAGISYQDLIRLNPGYNHWTTAPYHPYKLLIPADKVDEFSRNLANLPESKRVSWDRHQVSTGDSLNLIAQKYHTTVNLIKELNQLKSNAVKKGQYILVPRSKEIAEKLSNEHLSETLYQRRFKLTKKIKTIHIVQNGDDMRQIEQKYHVTATQIRKWNTLNHQASISPGQQLIIWKTIPRTGSYIVKKGDNLSSIAKLKKTSVHMLLRANPSLKKHSIYPGQKITLG